MSSQGDSNSAGISVEGGDSEGKSGKKRSEYTVCKSFDDMGLRDALLRGIYGHGFENPSAIQQRAILPVLDGNDTIAQAQSGTGKTATFAISVLQKLDLDNKMCQALVLAPTRELAQQICKVFRSLGEHLNVTVHACIGGTSVREDMHTLQVVTPPFHPWLTAVMGCINWILRDMKFICIFFSLLFSIIIHCPPYATIRVLDVCPFSTFSCFCPLVVALGSACD